MTQDPIISATTEFLVQSDKGCSEWYDTCYSSSEDVGKSDFAFLKQSRSWERHRLVRRITIDTQIA